MTSASFSPFPIGRKRLAISTLLTLIAIGSLMLTACGGSSNGAKSGKHKLTALGFVGGSYTQNMSPFSPNVNVGVDGLIYENLEFVNGVTGVRAPVQPGRLPGRP